MIEAWTVYTNFRLSAKARQELFGRIWESYHRRLYVFIRSRVGEEAEDLVHDVMLKVFENLDQYKPVYSFNSWIYAIARHHCINILRRRSVERSGRQILAAEADRGPEQPTPENEMLNRELNRRIERALDALPPDYRQIAFLRYYEKKRCRDISRIMDIPVGTVKSRLYAIRRRIEKALESDDVV